MFAQIIAPTIRTIARAARARNYMMVTRQCAAAENTINRSKTQGFPIPNIDYITNTIAYIKTLAHRQDPTLQIEYQCAGILLALDKGTILAQHRLSNNKVSMGDLDILPFDIKRTIADLVVV